MSGAIRSLLRVSAAVLAMGACSAVVAEAQTRATPPAKPAARAHKPAPHRGSIELGGGLAWDAGFDLGSLPAQETRNTGTDTSPFALFATSTRVRPAYGGLARVGYYITPSMSVEGGLQYLRPVLSTQISNDAEGAQSLTATETYSRYVFDVSLVWHFQRLSFAGRKGVPFLLAGGGYIRELHDGSGLLETGTEYHAGAGIKYWLTQGSHRFALRGEVSLASRAGAFDFGDGRRTLARAGAGVYLVF